MEKKNEEDYLSLERAEDQLDPLQKIMTDIRFSVLTNPEYQGKKLFFIMRGVPGSGKSTVAKEITHHEGVIHSTDSYFYNDKQEYHRVSEKLPEFHEKNFLAFRESLAQNQPIIVLDNTNTRRWEFDRYIHEAEKEGYIIEEIAMPFPDPNEAGERNIHGVPAEAIQRMIKRFEK